MNTLGLCAGVHPSLAFGLAALLWPAKFIPLFEILMFPWAASSRAIRANGIAAIGLSPYLSPSGLLAIADRDRTAAQPIPRLSASS